MTATLRVNLVETAADITASVDLWHAAAEPRAEIAADNARQGGQAMAPFRPEAQTNGAAAPAPAFGVGPGVAPDPALTQALDDIFGN